MTSRRVCFGAHGSKLYLITENFHNFSNKTEASKFVYMDLADRVDGMDMIGIGVGSCVLG